MQQQYPQAPYYPSAAPPVWTVTRQYDNAGARMRDEANMAYCG